LRAAHPTAAARTRALAGFLDRYSYNFHRPHKALGGILPAKRLAERTNPVPPTPGAPAS
jgi:hypothetical protein